MVARYDAKVLRIGEFRNCERKYGSAVIMTECIVKFPRRTSDETPPTYHSKAVGPQNRA